MRDVGYTFILAMLGIIIWAYLISKPEPKPTDTQKYVRTIDSLESQLDNILILYRIKVKEVETLRRLYEQAKKNKPAKVNIKEQKEIDSLLKVLYPEVK